MNIMKTNMLLLDNKILKEDAENTATIAAPVPSPAQAQAGMNALMFQGMKNLMANPELAREVGVMNDESADNTNETTAKSQNAPSNIAFQGKFSKMADKVGNKAMKTFLPTLMMVSTLLPGALGLASCEKDEINNPTTVSQHVEVTIDTDQMVALLGQMNTTLLQLLAQNKITAEEFAAYRAEVAAWMTSMSGKVDNLTAKVDAMNKTLISIADKVIDIDNGVQESNAYQLIVITMLENLGYSHAQAIALLEQAIQVAKENGNNTQKGIEKLIELLGLTNDKLDTLINKVDEANKQRAYETDLLEKILATGEATREEVAAVHESVIETNNTLKEVGKTLSKQLKTVDADMKNAIGWLAAQNGWSTMQVLNALAGLGIKIDNNTAAQYITAGMLSAQLDAIQDAIEKQTEEIKGARTDFNSFTITAQEYADKTLDILGSIEGRLGVFMEDFVQYADAVTAALGDLKAEAKKANATLSSVNAKVAVLNKQMEQVKGIALQISKDVKSIDRNVVKTKEDLARAIGVQTAVLDRALQFLGYTYAQYSTWNADRIIAAFTKSINSQNELIDANGKKLDDILDAIKAVNAGSGSDSEKLAKIIEILDGIAQDVSDIKDMISSWGAKLDALTARVDKLTAYARDIRNDQRYIAGAVTFIQGEIYGLHQDLVSVNETEQKILEKLESNQPLTAEEMEEIAKRLNGNVQEGMAGLAALLRTDIAQNNTMINILLGMGAKLDKLGTLSQDILNEIANLGDDLSGLSALGDKIDALIEAVNNLANKFVTYAKAALNAHAQEIALLKDVKCEVRNLSTKATTLINEVKKAEVQRQLINNNITQLRNQVTNLEAKLGRSITPEELDSILSKHDKENYQVWLDLASKVTIQAKDYSSALEYLTALVEILVTGQGQTNGYLLELLEAAKKNPELADRIIAAIENMNIVVTCQGDCDHNKEIHEGEISYLK